MPQYNQLYHRNDQLLPIQLYAYDHQMHIFVNYCAVILTSFNMITKYSVVDSLDCYCQQQSATFGQDDIAQLP